MMAMFTAAVESSIVATAMPTIVSDLGGFQLFSWVFSAYLLTQTVTIPIYGRLADLYGRKPVFYVGTGIFIVGSTLCGFAHGMVSLIVYRAIQGIGAGAIVPVASTIVGDIYSGEERARIQGYLSSVWGVSAIVGPSLGAFLVQHFHWAIIFWLNVPIGAAAITMIALFLRERAATRQHHVDYLGAMLMMSGFGGLMFALTEAGEVGPGILWGTTAAALIALGIFVLRERIAAEPMLPLGLWRNRIIAVANLASLTVGMTMMGVTAFLPAYIQGAMGRSAAIAGILLTIMSVSWSCASTAMGRLMVRTSYRTTALLGGLSLLAGSVVLAFLEPSSGLAFVSVGAAFVGFGLGSYNVTFVVAIQSSVEYHARAVATSSNLFTRQMGRTLGAAVMGALLNFGVERNLPNAGHVVDRMMQPDFRGSIPQAELAHVTGVLAAALHNVYLLAAALAVVALVTTAYFPAGLRPTDKRTP